MSSIFNKNIDDIYFQDKKVLKIIYGNKLLYDYGQKPIPPEPGPSPVDDSYMVSLNSDYNSLYTVFSINPKTTRTIKEIYLLRLAKNVWDNPAERKFRIVPYSYKTIGLQERLKNDTDYSLWNMLMYNSDYEKSVTWHTDEKATYIVDNEEKEVNICHCTLSTEYTLESDKQYFFMVELCSYQDTSVNLCLCWNKKIEGIEKLGYDQDAGEVACLNKYNQTLTKYPPAEWVISVNMY